LKALKDFKGLKGPSWPERPLKDKGLKVSRAVKGPAGLLQTFKGFTGLQGSWPFEAFKSLQGMSSSVLLRLSRPFKILKGFKTLNGLKGLHS